MGVTIPSASGTGLCKEASWVRASTWARMNWRVGQHQYCMVSAWSYCLSSCPELIQWRMVNTECKPKPNNAVFSCFCSYCFITATEWTWVETVLCPFCLFWLLLFNVGITMRLTVLTIPGSYFMWGWLCLQSLDLISCFLTFSASNKQTKILLVLQWKVLRIFSDYVDENKWLA